MISYYGLIKLGFKPEDFKLQDNSDGKGVFIAEWNSKSPQPSESDITTAHNEHEAEYDAAAYQRTRAAAYPELKEQLDLLYHDMTAGKLDATGEWHKAVKAVKDATAKPS
tara:strand:- start:4 stop:333 length:330 start_codon:yes stop_codon:yes gene_type:complete